MVPSRHLSPLRQWEARPAGMSKQPKGSHHLDEDAVTDEYLTLQQLTAYSKVSARQLRRYLRLPPGQALPCLTRQRRRQRGSRRALALVQVEAFVCLPAAHGLLVRASALTRVDRQCS